MSVYVCQTPDPSLVMLLVALANSTGRRYCFPSHAWLRAELKKQYGRVLGARMLCYHLSALEGSHWFRRQRRHRASTRGMEFHSTLYTLSRRAWATARRITGAIRERLQRRRTPNDRSAAPVSVVTADPKPRSRPPPEFVHALDRLNSGAKKGR